MILTAAALAGCILDLLLADPAWMPHPVVLMGRVITWMESLLRRCFPHSPKGELAGGAVLAGTLPAVVFAFSFGICRLCLRIHPALYFAAESIWCWQALAARGLALEAEAVQRILVRLQKTQSGREQEVLEEARAQISRIVGRDTDSLDRSGIIRACVETVAENSSDGVAAPLLFMLVGGAPLALAYKAVNTMDSMIGYRNERYRYFGRPAARLDDAANFLPSRITALFWTAAAFPDPEADGANAWRIWRRDRKKSASPNAGQTESACAGALHVQLAGPASYFGSLTDKPWIGDADRPVEAEDIRRSVRLMWISSFFVLAAGICLRTLVLRILP